MYCLRTAAVALAASLVLGGVLLSAPTTQAEEAETSATERCLNELIAGAQTQGWRLRGTDEDSIGLKQSRDYRLTLYNGSEYLFMSCAGGEGVDLDLYLYDEAGALVSADKAVDAQPFVEVSPGQTGEYALQVFLFASQQPQSDFRMALLYR